MSLLAERIRKQMVQAISDYDMIRDGDRIMVAVSGGKDSAVLALLLEEIRRRSERKFTIQAVMLDQKQPGFDAYDFKAWMESKGLPLTIIEEDTYSIVTDKVEPGKSFCGLCSRLRRGILYNYAHAHNLSKIALGHHRDDLNATVLLNMFYAGTIASMPPKLLSDDERNVVIRPLCYVPEKTLEEYSAELQIPVIPCNLCGSQENLRRAKIKKMLQDLEKDSVDLGYKMLAAQKNLKPSQLADTRFQDFTRF